MVSFYIFMKIGFRWSDESRERRGDEDDDYEDDEDDEEDDDNPQQGRAETLRGAGD